MENLALIKSQNFGSVKCDFYKNENEEILMTREQIGNALDYVEPRIAIYKIHERHKDRLDKFSVVTNLTTTDKKAYETYLYNAKGVYEICRWSQQPKADEFMDWVWEVIEEIRKYGSYSIDVKQQQKIIGSIKADIIMLFEEKLSEVKEYYKIKAQSKHNISTYIKERLGIVRANDEYEQVKARIFLSLGINKWEDLDIDSYKHILPLVDESIRVIKADRPIQITMWG